jgi:hypothetical protein
MDKVACTHAELEDGQTLEDYIQVFKDLLGHTFELFMEGLRFNM